MESCIGRCGPNWACPWYHHFVPAASVVAIFDSDPEKIGTAWGPIECSLDVFEKVMEEREVELVILAIPADAAQEVASRAVEAGGMEF